jgi:hypothetical protein
MAIPKQPEMTAGGSTIQLCSDFQTWLLWAKTYHPTAPPEIRKEAERRAQLCGFSLDDNTNTDKLEPTPMAKTKTKPAAPHKNKRTVGVHVENGEDLDRAVARTYLKPTVSAALTMQPWNSDLSVEGIREALSEQIDRVAKGDLSRPENILLCQSHTLDALFNTLAAKAMDQTFIPNLETFLRLALKAQAQCRCTLEALSNIKNPPVIFAKQANINNNGNQQINNGLPASRGEKIKKEPNELVLEEAHYAGTTLDTGATGTAIPVNSQLEAVEKGRS